MEFLTQGRISDCHNKVPINFPVTLDGGSETGPGVLPLKCHYVLTASSKGLDVSKLKQVTTVYST